MIVAIVVGATVVRVVNGNGNSLTNYSERYQSHHASMQVCKYAS